MRWMWIDRIVDFESGQRLVAIKNVSLAEDHLHDHFEADGELPAVPIMPASLMIEGMAQTAGILVGATGGFREKVVLAKIVRADIDRDVVPGDCVRYAATLERMDPAGAATTGTIERRGANEDAWESIGRVELMFSHIDQNMAGLAFPEENFVFSENFKTLLTSAGLADLVPT